MVATRGLPGEVPALQNPPVERAARLRFARQTKTHAQRPPARALDAKKPGRPALKTAAMQTTLFRKATFVLDAFEGETFEGYTQGETWNGFECPYFPFDSAQRLMEVLQDAGQVAFYDAQHDQFVCAEEDYEDDPDRYSALEVEGIGKIYPIGARVWTWSRAETARTQVT